jgi:hypothetical protein
MDTDFPSPSYFWLHPIYKLLSPTRFFIGTQGGVVCDVSRVGREGGCYRQEHTLPSVSIISLVCVCFPIMPCIDISFLWTHQSAWPISDHLFVLNVGGDTAAADSSVSVPPFDALTTIAPQLTSPHPPICCSSFPLLRTISRWRIKTYK